MIDRQIRTQIVLAGDTFDVFPGTESGVDFFMSKGREPTVSVGRIKRQDMNSPNGVVKMFLDYGIEIAEIITQTIGIADQLYSVAQ